MKGHKYLAKAALRHAQPPNARPGKPGGKQADQADEKDLSKRTLADLLAVTPRFTKSVTKDKDGKEAAWKRVSEAPTAKTMERALKSCCINK